MNTTKPTAAGYVVTDNELIHGYGDTADAAWADMERTMAAAQIHLLDDDDDSHERVDSWARRSDFTVRAASAALLADTKTMGGAIGWYDVGGVACTTAEWVAN
jgi:hypothetical protein